MAKTIQEWLYIQAIKKAVEQLKGTPMFDFLSGYKTYIVGGAMVLVGGLALLGVDIPAFPVADGGKMILEGFGLIFLRQGVKKIGQ